MQQVVKIPEPLVFFLTRTVSSFMYLQVLLFRMNVSLCFRGTHMLNNTTKSTLSLMKTVISFKGITSLTLILDAL